MIKLGFTTPEKIEEALEYQKNWGGKLGDILLAHGHIGEEQLTKCLAQVSGLPAIDLSKVELSMQAKQHISAIFCHQNHLVPVMLKKIANKDHLVVAFSDPLDLEVIDEIRFMVNMPVYRVVATKSMIKNAISTMFPNLINEMPTATDLLSLAEEAHDMEDSIENTNNGTSSLRKSSSFGHIQKLQAGFLSLTQVLKTKGLLNQKELDELKTMVEWDK